METYEFVEEFVHYQDLSVEQRWGGSDEPTERSLEYHENFILTDDFYCF